MYKEFVKMRSLGIESIANPRLGKNQARICRIGFDFLAKLADEDSKILMLSGVITAPNSAEQGPMREHFARIAHEVR